MKVNFSVFVLIFAFVEIAHAADTLPAMGTKESVAHQDGIEIEVIVQSPSAQQTPLQIICLFEYMEGDIFNAPPALPKELNGMVHVDEALHGLITDLRKSNKFEGRALETLLLSPKAPSIAAEKLLIIGLGNRHDFKPEIMRMVGVIGMREALRLGVSSYSHASDLKDAGISSPTAAVAAYVVKGALEALRTQRYLKENNASDALTVTKLSLLSGPAFFEETVAGLKKIAK